MVRCYLYGLVWLGSNLQELINTQEQFHVVLDELNRVKTEQRQELDELQVARQYLILLIPRFTEMLIMLYKTHSAYLMYESCYMPTL